MPSKPKISIILPTYNEALGISRFLDKVIPVVSQMAQAEKKPLTQYAEIIVVDDNSPDGTAAVVKTYSQSQPAVKLLVRYKDHGLGVSILAGIEAANGEVIVGMDADNNHDIALLPKLITKLDQADLVVASRFMGSGGMAEPIRFYGTWAFNAFLRCFGFPIWDNFSGYYAIKKATLLTLQPANIYYGYGDYHLRLVYIANQVGLKILEVPTIYLKRIAGESKSRLGKMLVSYTLEAFRLRFKRP
jgi:dolichol-phosphate mannosyltransferase